MSSDKIIENHTSIKNFLNVIMLKMKEFKNDIMEKYNNNNKQ